MLSQNGPSVYADQYAADTQNAPQAKKNLKDAQEEFLAFITFHGIEELCQSLQLIHDLALYHSYICFDNHEKSALYNVKILSEQLALLATPGKAKAGLPVICREDNLYI